MIATDVRPASSFQAASIVGQAQKPRLVAEWAMTNGKLVCEWVMN